MDFIPEVEVRVADPVQCWRLIDDDDDIDSNIARLIGINDLSIEEAREIVLDNINLKKGKKWDAKVFQLQNDETMRHIYNKETIRLINVEKSKERSKKVLKLIEAKKNNLQSISQRLARNGHKDLSNHLQTFINSDDDLMKLSNELSLKLFEEKDMPQAEKEKLYEYFEDDLEDEGDY
jgi:hypothetical protein